MNEEVTTAESDVADSELPKDDTVLGSVMTLDSMEVACAELDSVMELCVVTGPDSVEVTCSESLKDGTELGSVTELCVVRLSDTTASSEALLVKSTDMKRVEMPATF